MHLKFQLSFASVMLMIYVIILFWENGKIVLVNKLYIILMNIAQV